MRTISITAAVLAALVCADPAAAHHSGYMYETSPIWVKGAVVYFEHKNPHTVITLEGRDDAGQIRRWAVEGPSQSEIDRTGLGADLPNVGDTVEFCAFPYRSAAAIANDPRILKTDPAAEQQLAAAEGRSPQFVAGHVMVTADGKKRLWEPHGVLSACLGRANAETQSWLDFFNATPGARQALCEQRGRPNVQSDAALKQRVEDLSRSLAEPCK